MTTVYPSLRVTIRECGGPGQLSTSLVRRASSSALRILPDTSKVSYIRSTPSVASIQEDNLHPQVVSEKSSHLELIPFWGQYAEQY
jgi:hypothetical protein